MSAVNVQYTKELRERFGYSATWVPTSEVRLGDVGRLHRYEFERVTTLDNFNVHFDRYEFTRTPIPGRVGAPDVFQLIPKKAPTDDRGASRTYRTDSSASQARNRAHAVGGAPN